VSRPRVDVQVPALALRRAEAAAALAVSLETFDAHIRPRVAAVQVGGVIVYPRAELERFLAQHAHVGGYDQDGKSKRARTVGAAGPMVHQEEPLMNAPQPSPEMG
jgi:hypothetical protein